MRNCLIGATLLAATACASTPGVVSIGPDTYMVSRQAATGFSGTGGLMTAAMREAETFCRGKSKTMQVVNTHESTPPFIMGNFPKAEVQFMCLAEGDPELTRPKLQPTPNVVIAAPSAGGSAQTPQSTPAQSVERVRVSIESEPPGADVSVNGVFVGNTPLPEYSLPPGEHLVEVSKPGFKVWSRRMAVASGTPTSVRAMLEPAQP